MSEPPPEPSDVTPDPLSTLALPLAATRYDAALAVILLAFVAAAVVALAVDIGPIAPLVLPAAAGVLVIVDTCYLHPPIGHDPE